MKRTALITAILLLTGFTAAQTSSQIEIDVKNTEPTPLQTSEYADIWLEVKNVGDADAENVEVRFTENYPFSVVRGDRKNWSIGELIPGEEYQIHLEARVDSNAVQSNDSLDFWVQQGGFGSTEKVPVEVRSDRNVLEVQSVDFPDKAAPGSTNQMQLGLNNPTSGQLKNIQISLDLSEDLPMATSESSTKNIVNIEAGESESINYTLNIDESAENSVYKLPIDIEFENEAGTQFNQATTTGVNVGGEPSLEPALNTDTTLKDGSTEELTFRLVNRGHGSADFVSMQLEETDNIEVIGSDEVYIGSMDSDDFQTASFRVNVNAETESVDIDTLEMPVKLEYTDSEGEQSETQTLEAQLYTQQELQQYGIASGSNIIPVIVVVVLLAAGGIYYWRRKKKKE